MLISILESTQSVPLKTLKKIKAEIELNPGRNVLPILVSKNLLSLEVAESVEYLVLELKKNFPSCNNSQTQRQVNPCLLPTGTKRDILFARFAFAQGLCSLDMINECFYEQHKNEKNSKKLGQIMVAKRIISGSDFVKIQKDIEEKVKKKDINTIILEDKMTRVTSVDGLLSLVEISIPKIFGSYHIIEEIARGGMGVVYKAWDERLKRVVALKVLKQWEYPSVEETQRFQREARLAASLQHSNIVKIHDADAINGVHYFTMDYVEGQPLSQVIREKRLAYRDGLKIIKDIALALDYAHSKEVVHRDVKPGNIILDRDENAKLTDFGLAKALNADNTFITQSGKTIGTPAYMSPEQAKGKKSIDARSDIYSLGAILYEIITGQPPFCGDSFGIVISDVISKEPKRPSRINSSIPLDIETICLKAMSKELEHRYATAQEMSDDIDRYLFGKNIQAKRHFHFMKAWNINGSALLLSLLLLLAGFGIFTWNLNKTLKRYQEDHSLFVKSQKLTLQRKFALAKTVQHKIQEKRLRQKLQVIFKRISFAAIQESNKYLSLYQKNKQLYEQKHNGSEMEKQLTQKQKQENYKNLIRAFDSLEIACTLSDDPKASAILKKIYEINVEISRETGNSLHVDWFLFRLQNLARKHNK